MKLPGFDIIDKVGEDRLTVIWEANQTSLNRVVSLKILRPQFASDPGQVREFLAEGRVIAQLKHPGILQVYDVVEKDGVYFFVVEHVSGSTLAKVLESDGKLSAKRSLSMAKQMADALRHAWRASHLLHRNLKPENIHVDSDDHVRVAFFGHSKVATPMEKGEEEDGTLVGTPYYMSPEQARCQADLDARSDMYSLGCVLYQMTTGCVPFEAFDPMTAADKQIADHVPHPRVLVPSLARGVGTLIEGLMVKDRQFRPANWDAVLDDIGKLLAGKPLIKKLPAEAVSTVEPEQRAAPAPTPAYRAATAPRRRGLSIPLWVQVPAWGLLTAWWYILAQFMMEYWAAP